MKTTISALIFFLGFFADPPATTVRVREGDPSGRAAFANGFTQYEDAQMRAEFFPLFHNKNHGGDGDDSFHVILGHPQTLLPVQIEVPVGSSEVFVDSNGTFFALIDINFISSQLNTLLQTEPINVQSIPIFLTRNAVYGDFSKQQPVDCCIAVSGPGTLKLCVVVKMPHPATSFRRVCNHPIFYFDRAVASCKTTGSRLIPCGAWR